MGIYSTNPDRWAILPGEYDEMHSYDSCPITLALAPGCTGAAIPCVAEGAAAVLLGGVWRGRVRFEGSMDGLIWRPVALLPLDSDAPATEATQPGCWRTLPRQSPRFLRVHAQTLPLGTVAVSVTSLPALESAHSDVLDHAA